MVLEYFNKLEFKEVPQKEIDAFLERLKMFGEDINKYNFSNKPSYKAVLKTPGGYEIVVYKGGMAFGRDGTYDVTVFYKKNPLHSWDEASKEELDEIIKEFWNEDK